MDDLLKEFLTEATENVATIDVELVKLENATNDKETLSSIFRLVHTIKGTSGFLGLARLGAVAHAGENVLGRFRDGAPVTPAAVSLVFRCIDTIRMVLGALESTGAEPEGSDAEIIAALNAAADATQAPSAAAAPPQAADSAAGEYVPAAEEGFPVAAELLAEVAAIVASEKPATAPERPRDVPAAAPVAAKPDVAKPDAETREGALSAASIRVNVDVLENLMTLVSELVLTRNQLLQMVRGRDSGEFKVPLQRLSHITSDLQEGVMKSRMQPIGNAWSKLPRIIRDLSVELGKKIVLNMQGAETELDRQVLELIRDPLTHMVRNSADHGVEGPAVRVAAGKPETGTITLSAFHEGGHIVIVVADDGKGLDANKIKAKALANGFATEAELAAMSDQQVLQLIFRAGLSTSEKVTSVSGRGVGMDVVRTNVEKIGGTIELTSVAGKGTSFTIKIPLTLAIVSALVVEAGGQRFAIPQINVLELVRTSLGSGTQIETVNASPVLRLRDRLLPLVSLRSLLHLDERQVAPSADQFIVVAQVGAYRVGIIVDRVFDTEEIVVKPVAPVLRKIPFYSGNTILGDGSVIMILDPNGIAVSAGQRPSSGDNAGHAATNDERGRVERVSLLVFEAAGGQPRAVPLALVERLEDIDLASVERAHGQHVIQYRDRLMPLIPFAADFEWRKEGQQPVIVFADGERSMGLVVDRIVDIVSENLTVELRSNADGILGSAVLANRATDIIDAGHFLMRAFRDWFESAESAPRRVLLVDRSRFYRNLVASQLGAAGWQLLQAESEADAVRLLETEGPFAAVAIDLKSGLAQGLAVAAKVRATGRHADVPLIGLAGMANGTGANAARAAGFTTTLARADRSGLLRALESLTQPPAELRESA